MTRIVGAISANASGNRIRLDWKAYFFKFIEAHGEPVKYDEDRLLFRDGWQYAIKDYQGPEYAPPDDRNKLRDLKRRYWEILQGKLQCEHDELRGYIDALKRWDTQRDQPLQQRIVYESRDEHGVVTLVSEAEDLNVSSLEAKLEGLQYLLKECEEHLNPF